MSKREFEVGKVCLARCKSNFHNIVTEGNIYRCKRKFLPKGLRWMTTHRAGTSEGEFCFSWSWNHWKKHFEKPLKPLSLSDFKVGEEYLCIEDCGEFFKKGEKYIPIMIGKHGVYFKDKDRGVMFESDLSYFWVEESKKELKLVEDFCGRFIKNYTQNEILPPLFDLFSNEEYYTKEESPSYHFRDDEINWDQIVNDMLEDNVPLFIVESVSKANGGDECYVGGINNPEFSWGSIFKKYISEYTDEEVDRLESYEFFKIHSTVSKYKIKELCKEYTKKYNEWKESLKNTITDRSREKKNPKKYSVRCYK